MRSGWLSEDCVNLSDSTRGMLYGIPALDVERRAFPEISSGGNAESADHRHGVRDPDAG